MDVAMNWLIPLTALLELAAVVTVIRLWLRKQGRWITRFLWTILLPIPVFGLLFYLFVRLNPEPHNNQIYPSWY